MKFSKLIFVVSVFLVPFGSSAGPVRKVASHGGGKLHTLRLGKDKSQMVCGLLARADMKTAKDVRCDFTSQNGDGSFYEPTGCIASDNHIDGSEEIARSLLLVLPDNLKSGDDLTKFSIFVDSVDCSNKDSAVLKFEKSGS